MKEAIRMSLEMKQNCELMERLSEIYTQLEQAENILEVNNSSKEQWQSHYAKKIFDFSKRITVLEMEGSFSSERIAGNNKRRKLDISQKMKLKLGFR